jgi:hypothetical protein
MAKSDPERLLTQAASAEISDEVAKTADNISAVHYSVSERLRARYYIDEGPRRDASRSSDGFPCECSAQLSSEHDVERALQ